MMKLKKSICLIILINLLLLSACSNEQDTVDTSGDLVPTQQSEKQVKYQDSGADVTTEDIDLSNFFNGIDGCAVLYSPKDNQYSLYNSNICQQEVSPYSTFKIISALIGLENGVIQDETSKLDYRGAQYPIVEWNSNLTLEDAFSTSCIWYFRQVIDVVGPKDVSKALDDLQYGNCDISEWNGSGINPQKELNGFWLNSSLKISPLEQVQVLSKIFEGETIYSDENVEILKNIMLLEQFENQRIYGKTGSGPEGKAWFVGLVEKDEAKEYFAIYLDDIKQKEMVSGSTAKEIGLKIVKSRDNQLEETE